MGFLDNLGHTGGKAAGEAARTTLEGVGEAAEGIRTAITGDIPAEKRAELEEQAKKLEAEVRKGQTAVNEAEAQHHSIFVAGWRPFIGWVGGLGLAFQFVIRPLLQWGMIVGGVGEDVPELPRLDLTDLITILGGMLGLGTLRTREKEKGVQGKH